MARCLDVLMTRRIVCRAAALALLLAVNTCPTIAQLNSRPASVVLVATLESLSMGVGQEQAYVQPIAPVTPQLAVTASWALPANLTTLRLMRVTPQAESSSEGVTVWSQSSGATNRAGSRSEVLEIPSGAPEAAQEIPDLKRGPILLLIEAL